MSLPCVWLWRKNFKFSHLTTMLVVGLTLKHLFCWNVFLLSIIYSETLSLKYVEFSKSFSSSIEMIVCLFWFWFCCPSFCRGGTYPLRSECTKKVCCLYIMEYYSSKKEEELVIGDSVDEPGSHYGKWNATGTERQILYDLTYPWNSQE
jgi:hypothetical protein